MDEICSFLSFSAELQEAAAEDAAVKLKINSLIQNLDFISLLCFTKQNLKMILQNRSFL